MIYKKMDSPQFLTDEQIRMILSRVAPPQIMITELREHVHREIKIKFKQQLELIKIRPSKIEKLGDYIANKTERSYFQPGTPVGFNVAESIGQPATQLVLNTFHSAGQSSQSGFKRLQTNIRVRPYKKEANNYNMYIHMNDKNISYEDLYIKAQKFLSVKITDLLSESIIKEEYPFDDMSMYTEDFKKLSDYEDQGYGIRLRFNREKLLLHQIPLENISMEIYNRVGSNKISIFFSSQYDSVIDIYPKKEGICNDPDMDFIECCKNFENGELRIYLDDEKKKLGEYPNIMEVKVNKIDITKLIEEVTPHYEDGEESPGKARVWVKLVFAKKEGIPDDKLYDLLNLSGFKVVGKDPEDNFFVVESDNLKVKEEITKKLKEEDKRLIEKYDETGFLESTDLYRAGYYNMITTKGSDLAAVRLDPEVDEFTTISNWVMEINEVLGLEVARSFLEKDIFDLFEENGRNIAPRNISIMVDWMTASIRPISVNPKSILKSDYSALRAMCFDDPKNNIIKGAILGSEEALSNTSVRVLFGVKQTTGTGAFKVVEDPDVVKLYDTMETGRESGSLLLTKDTLSRVGSDSNATRSRVRLPRAQKPTNDILPTPDLGIFGDDESDILSQEDIQFQL